MSRTQAKANNAVTNETEIVEWWWRFRPRIAYGPATAEGTGGNEISAKDALRKRSKELEAIVEPHVTTRKTSDAILFKGRRRYVKSKLHDQGRENRLTWAAIFALQCIYNIEAAWKAGDVDAALHWTYGFARCDFDVMVIQRCGWEAWGAVALWELDTMKARTRSKNQAKGPKKRLGESKLQDHDDLVKSLHDECRDKPRWMRRLRQALADKEVFAGTDTIRKRLKHLGIYRK